MKWTWWSVFISWTGLFALIIALIAWDKVCILRSSLQLRVNSRADFVFYFYSGKWSMSRKILDPKSDFVSHLACVEGVVHTHTQTYIYDKYVNDLCVYIYNFRLIYTDIIHSHIHKDSAYIYAYTHTCSHKPHLYAPKHIYGDIYNVTMLITRHWFYGLVFCFI